MPNHTDSNGFKINWMNLRDAETGRIVWESSDWSDALERTVDAHVPKSILQCQSVSRELNFSSRDVMQGLRVEQIVAVCGEVVEEWNFSFGFVIPHSTNTWQSVVEAAGEGEMCDAGILSGNTVIQTTFYDGNVVVARMDVRVFYD